MTSTTGSQHIDLDLPCAGCGYNLRGLAMDGSCPECGRAIRKTVPARGHIEFFPAAERGRFIRVMRRLFRRSDERCIWMLGEDSVVQLHPRHSRTELHHDVITEYRRGPYLAIRTVYFDRLIVVPSATPGKERIIAWLDAWGVPGRSMLWSYTFWVFLIVFITVGVVSGTGDGVINIIAHGVMAVFFTVVAFTIALRRYSNRLFQVGMVISTAAYAIFYAFKIFGR